MTDPVKTCANCGHSQASGDYCEACGTRLPMEAPLVGSIPPSQTVPPHTGSRPPGTPPVGMGQVAPPMYSPPSRGNGFWSRFFDLSFEHFITPSIVKVLFVIAMVLIGLGMLAWVIVGFVSFGVYGILVLIGTLILGFVSVLLARVFLEMVVVFFRIRDDTEELVRKKR